ncbi:MAG: sigma 54-interacting transcriptional regulator [Polyangiaceae bacterium]
MSTTETDSIQLASSSVSRELVPRLTIVRHPDPTLVGVGAPIGNDAMLGRDTAFLAGALDHGRVSREHARLRRKPNGTLVIEDRGSRNGTIVDGELIEGETELADGAVIGVGPVMLLFHRAPRYVATRPHPIVWSVSHAMAQVIEQVRRAAREEGNVVLIGETGVGKEVVAQALHDESGRTGELLAVNCAAVSDGVLQSELFGHERGAFSGADTTKVGLIEAAEHGTLFLDEIASASPALQAALLRVLQDGKVRRVGATATKAVDVRFVAALLDGEQAGAGALREDLWFRLARRTIAIPPLRERREDIPYLAQRFAAHAAEQPVRLGRRLAWQLLAHDWPGNVRELRGVIEALVTDHPPREVDGFLELEVEAPLFPPPRRRPSSGALKEGGVTKPARRPSRSELEALLREHEGQIASVARAVGVPRKTVYRWLKALNIEPDGFRDEP